MSIEQHQAASTLWASQHCLKIKMQENSCHSSSEWLEKAGRTSSHLLAGHCEEWSIIPQPQYGRYHWAGTRQTTLEVTGSKRSYALKWCKPNSDNDDDIFNILYIYIEVQCNWYFILQVWNYKSYLSCVIIIYRQKLFRKLCVRISLIRQSSYVAGY